MFADRLSRCARADPDISAARSTRWFGHPLGAGFGPADTLLSRSSTGSCWPRWWVPRGLRRGSLRCRPSPSPSAP